MANNNWTIKKYEWDMDYSSVSKHLKEQYHSIDKKIIHYIASTRIKLGLSQRQLAKAAGINKVSYNQVEKSNKRAFTQKELIRLLHTFDAIMVNTFEGMRGDSLYQFYSRIATVDGVPNDFGMTYGEKEEALETYRSNQKEYLNTISRMEEECNELQRTISVLTKALATAQDEISSLKE